MRSVDREFGVFLGLIAAAAIAYGGWRSMQEEGTTFGGEADRLGDQVGDGSDESPPPSPPSREGRRAPTVVAGPRRLSR